METIAASVWQKSKLLIKGLMIGVLVLLLLIPAFFVQDLIREREARQKEAVVEVSSKWAGRQNITGPVLVIPYNENTTGSDGKPLIVRHQAYFLPDKLDIRAEVKPEKRYRGIYQVMLYSSTINISGKFSPVQLEKLKLQPSDLLWSDAYISMGVSDAKGLNNEIQVKWNDLLIGLNPASSGHTSLGELFTAPIQLTAGDIAKDISFSSTLNLNGSEQLLFTPIGKETTAEMRSSWPDPSFTGSQLPLNSDITKNGFTARWKNLSHTRKFPQQWTDNAYTVGRTSSYNGMDTMNSLSSEAFGAGLFVPVSGYQKTMRSVKYAILCILLTFAAFFIIETVNKRSVHPFQYALIGLALILFYTLLLSFSEYTGFNMAYIIASVATTGLIAWFVKGLLQSSRLTSVLSVILVLMYSYIFTILQLQDYSLLLGSIGLFLTLAVIMHFSKRIQW
ncbi:MAG: cell envelope integrity protein CreD [Chitinophagaceae bacterium]|nr:cell envelope integrity protein CreD [Chitinophagaceae bacterium]